MTTKDEIKKLLKSDKLIIGSDRVLKAVRASKIEKVFVSANCASSTIDDLEHYVEISNFSLEKLDVSNDELGTICKKPFSVSIIGILK